MKRKMMSGRVQRRPTNVKCYVLGLVGHFGDRFTVAPPTSDWIGTTTILGSFETEQVIVLRVNFP